MFRGELKTSTIVDAYENLALIKFYPTARFIVDFVENKYWPHFARCQDDIF